MLDNVNKTCFFVGEFGSMSAMFCGAGHGQSFVDRYVEQFFRAEAKGFSAGGEGPPYHVIGVHMRSGMQENSQDVRRFCPRKSLIVSACLLVPFQY